LALLQSDQTDKRDPADPALELESTPQQKAMKSNDRLRLALMAENTQGRMLQTPQCEQLLMVQMLFY
jgi:hypothetical protein